MVPLPLVSPPLPLTEVPLPYGGAPRPYIDAPPLYAGAPLPDAGAPPPLGSAVRPLIPLRAIPPLPLDDLNPLVNPLGASYLISSAFFSLFYPYLFMGGSFGRSSFFSSSSGLVTGVAIFCFKEPQLNVPADLMGTIFAFSYPSSSSYLFFFSSDVDSLLSLL